MSLRELLASRLHGIWAHWNSYMLSKCYNGLARTPGNSNLQNVTIIPKELVERWQRQIETPYDKLSEPEKESDRHQADKILGTSDEYVLIEYNDCWADEMNLKGSNVMKLEEWEFIVDNVRKHFEAGGTLTQSIGTNEEIEYQYFDRWMECYHTKPITYLEYLVLSHYQNVIGGKFYIPDENCEEYQEDE